MLSHNCQMGEKFRFPCISYTHRVSSLSLVGGVEFLAPHFPHTDSSLAGRVGVPTAALHSFQGLPVRVALSPLDSGESLNSPLDLLTVTSAGKGRDSSFQ